MTVISILGAGRSCGPLIDYLASHPDSGNWKIEVYDMNAEAIADKTDKHPEVQGETCDLSEISEVEQVVKHADIVVSMLPAFMHVPVAELCVHYRKHMVTASYASPEMKAMDKLAKDHDVALINEVGVDPGIDHMSTMSLLNTLRAKGAVIKGYESFTGGILAPESEDNPWHYKFTWNPRNVVLAGSGGAVKFIHGGKHKHIPYHQVFRRTEFLEIPGYGRFEGYANRDSLKYIDTYGLTDIETMYRGTLRRPGFCRAWDVFVKLGATDDSYQMEGVASMTHRDFLNSFLAYHPTDSIELKLMHYLGIPQDSDLLDKLEWLGLFNDEIVGIETGSPAQVLQHILDKRWHMTDDDVDMLVMLHLIDYELNGEMRRVQSSMVAKGKSRHETAMAFTVGVPVGIATALLAQGQIQGRGIQLPITEEFYVPIMKEMARLGLRFHEDDQLMS